MGISLPSSWIPGLQAATVLILAAGFFVDQPLSVVLAIALSALVMIQDEEGAPAEYRPITALLILSGLLFLAEYAAIAWGLALFCAAYALLTLVGIRPTQMIRQGFGEQKGPSTRQRSALRDPMAHKRRR